MSQSTVTQFTEEQVVVISRKFGEPKWLTDYRLSSLARFRELPLETSPLYTKYTGVSAFDPEQFPVKPVEEKIDLRAHFQGHLTGKETNILLQGNSTTVHVDLEESVARGGIKLLDIHEAIAKHEPLLRELLLSKRPVDPSKEKYAALNAAFFNSGTFVHVPPGLSDAALSTVRKMSVVKDPQASVIDLTILYAEEGSKLNYLEELYAGTASGPYLDSTVLDIVAEKGAHIEVSTLQLLDDQTVYLSNKGVTASSDSKVTLAEILLGSHVTRSRLNVNLDGRGSAFEGYEVFFCDGKQRYDLESNLIHNSPDSTAALTARGVLKDESQSIFKGMVKINHLAKNSSSYLAHHAMLLDKRARSDAIPGLDIDTNEVKATHSASVAQIDDEQVFYLMARGLPQDEAKKMIIIGFFEPVVSRIPVEFAREGAKFIIEGKWYGERRKLIDRETLIALTGEKPSEVKQGGSDIFERHYKYRG
ncbi:MAG: Fe-S cluster assembly protein SufD [Thaumarchaeota archaeon]|nr:Fe-S cluster assembly protein SufD [Nitrososphaerota archaeon]